MDQAGITKRPTGTYSQSSQTSSAKKQISKQADASMTTLIVLQKPSYKQQNELYQEAGEKFTNTIGVATSKRSMIS